ncbi:MAG: shikimate dehydrogenase [Dehalococcoidia bacterium]|nr:shikimate dehydrogenase [Dehalococcoidia bacterium]MDW8119958.1 shikimate dehydrogenase [Chloroflexota bacterium]
MSLRVGIIGYPVGHSLSPRMHQAAFSALGLDIRYEAWETPPQVLPQRIQSLRNGDILGANVTIPHKEAVLPLLDTLTPTARAIGAVNTIVHRHGTLLGENTDAPGFLRAVQEAGCPPQGKRVLILGAGGSARAVAYALAQAGVGSLTIAARTPDRAYAIARLLTVPVVCIPWEEEALTRAAAGADLIVHCTPLGMAHTPAAGDTPLRAEQIPPSVVVYDLVYTPEQTPLLREAQRAGARAVGGLGMLVHQGALAFELWTGRPAPIEVMWRAVRSAVQEARA